MHFRNPSVTRTKFVFKCGDNVLDLCTQYKYLGLFLDEYLSYDVTACHVAQSAHRALGLLIAKDKLQGGFDYKVFTKLYDTLVSPIIEYGPAIWGDKCFSCIEAVQHRASRYFLGVGKRAPNRAVEGI